ncbi:hypothetical protein BD410DRAFT_260575 [Rickenella mellea]|uniref:Protein kinase domain-containing protein n=1 Tax=Rickenella mellea TaxID=50990 RepID=A0A4Y7Q6H1_9AGAM|nr:hypothetical protein BD410DRAFT_260575 [Rickenella mellea]
MLSNWRQGALLDATQLTTYEKSWLQLQPFLLANGLQLRRRYQPGWVPSWNDDTLPEPGRPEDSIIPRNKNFIDAVRVSTGERVGLKLVELDEELGAQELEIIQYLSRGEVRNDPRNPCIPLLDILDPPTHPNQRLLVMPLLYEVMGPLFKSVSECEGFVGQILRGMEFLHRHKIAHKDICPHNLVMKAPGLYPKGCHPMDNLMTEDGSSYSDIRRLHKETRLFRGRYRDLPEYERPGPWDGYKIDVYCLGLLIDERVVKRCRHVHFLKPLVEWMTRNEPSERPTAQQAVEWFNTATSRPKFRRALSRVFAFL